MFYINDQFYSEQDLENRWRQLADNDGFNECRRLAVVTEDLFEWLAVALFCQRRGRSVAPIHPDTPKAGALEKARQLQCDGLVWQLAENIQRLTLDKQAADDRASGTLIQFSSGTTGAPKRVERRWSEIATEIEHYNRALDFEDDVVPVVACPVTHSYGLICGVMATLARGQTPHIVSGWNPKYLIRILSGYRKPVLYSSPTFIKALIDLWPADRPLYGVMTSGSAMPTRWFRALSQMTAQLWQQYGCSEAGCVAVARDPAESGIVGQPLGHCGIVAGTSSEQPGEVVVLQGERHIHTRDSGYLDRQGQLHFCGRLDDTIVVSGLNVYPREVEDALTDHEGIHDAVAFKVQDALAGERIGVFYTGDANLSETEVRRWCAGRLARHQWPSWVRYREELPRLPNGKISRRQLSRQYGQGGEAVQGQGAA
ncbi:AMP-binding protein [Marinimicrobium sp. C2-29]|uniref:AMP-binding protein n=1 Tax=Marinimicrobium sp. C2-29 TaxID=3139825 RepID=UPI003138DD5E